MVARTLMKPKLAKSHEKRMVRHRKVPNLAKNCRLQAKSGSDACRITHTRASSQCRGVACRHLARLSPGRRASRKRQRLTKIDVHMPLKTGEPISEKVFMRRSSLEP